MTYYIRNGNTFQVTDKGAVDIQESLPVANYIVKEDAMSGILYLEMVDSFKPIKKLYGNLPRYTDRILQTYQDRSSSTGVMFTGEKGSGKSLLGKEICIKAAEANIPTIIINSPWHGDKFNSLLQDITQDAVIFFDEFEKVYYDTHKQEAILTLLDGVYPTKKLFVLTCNDKWRIDQHMRNRPGRLFYMIDFKGLDREFIIEYCNDNLNNKEYIDKIVNLASLFSEFNFDMLKALVEDMNRYNESPQDVLSILNAKPEYEKNSSNKFEIELYTPSGRLVPTELLCSSNYNNNPLSDTEIYIYVYYDGNNTNTSSGSNGTRKISSDVKSIFEEIKPFIDEEDSFILFEQDELVKVDGERGIFEYKCRDSGCRLRLKKQERQLFDYFSRL